MALVDKEGTGYEGGRPAYVPLILTAAADKRCCPCRAQTLILKIYNRHNASSYSNLRF
jgi:hypothetical protein